VSALPLPLQTTLRTALSLLVFAVIGTALLAFTFNATKDSIAKNEEQAKLKLIGQILPTTAYDNNILQDTLILPPTPDLGSFEPSTVFRARKGGEPTAAVLEAIAPDGYGGKIKMVIAVYANGEIAGVRVISQNETPGLGDYIEIAKSDWINIFGGKSLAKLSDKEWKVKKDGGVFEHVAGATVTPRAVIKAVHKALIYFDQNKDKLFATQPSAKTGTGAAK